MRAIAIGIPFIRRSGIDAQAQAHYNRVIADGGLVPSGLSGVNAFFNTIKTIYATADITTAISVGLDAQVLGYKLGAGAGTTLGQAAQKLYSCSGASGDVVQTTAASQPLLLVHSGANYWWGSGQLGNFVETQTQSTLLFGADFSATFYCDPLSNTNMELGGTNTGGVNTTGFYIGSDRNMRASYLNILYTSTTTFAIGTKYFRYTMSGNNLQFYTSIDGITWVQLGTNLSVVVHTVMPSNRIRVGNATGAYALPTNGKIYNAKFYTDATLTNLVFDFNPAQYNAANSQTQWTSSTGEVWTINTGTATTGYKGHLCTKTIIQGDGVDDRLTSGTLTSRTSFTVYIAVNALSFSGRFMDGNLALTKTLYGTSSNISMFGGGGGFDFVGETPQRLQMLTANFQAAPNVYARVNNNARATTASSIGNSASTGINLFTDGGGANPANVMITTLIQSNTNDPLNDNMYNYIRSINNSAF